MVEQLQAKVQFLVDEAHRLTQEAMAQGHKAEETLSLAIKDTEAHIRVRAAHVLIMEFSTLRFIFWLLDFYTLRHICFVTCARRFSHAC